MTPQPNTLPLSLYIHIPWCVKKCPYCDFNSHVRDSTLPIERYLQALKNDLTLDKLLAQGREIETIFFGGGTPSLFPNWAVKDLLEHVHKEIGISRNAEITLEANPATVEHDTFEGLHQTGVNRLSLGVQSFNSSHLKALGRIHTSDDAITAYHRARDAGFNNINLDLMHGLPKQNIEQGLSDLNYAIDLKPEHISWYQLTIEPNTHFYSDTPTLPCEDILADIYDLGHNVLCDAKFKQYETSAYSLLGSQSRHNINYWSFGDYLAIGAGAHGKITLSENSTSVNSDSRIVRYNKTRLPDHYMQSQAVHLNKQNPYTSKYLPISINDLPLEFMMNALRLTEGIETDFFESRTGLSLNTITQALEKLRSDKLITQNNSLLCTTAHGHRHLNTVLNYFM